MPSLFYFQEQEAGQSNQRIEFWWGILRKRCSQYWINLFEELKEDGHFTGDFLDKSLIQLCFMNIIQVQTTLMRNVCNLHALAILRAQARRPRETCASQLK